MKKKESKEVDTISFELYRQDLVHGMWDRFLEGRNGLDLTDEENEELDRFLFNRYHGFVGDTSCYGFGKRFRRR